jgi:hypothetical protein
MRPMLWILVAYLALCLVALFRRPIGLAWGRFWHAVLMWRYLGVPWVVARDRARRRGL